MIRGDLAFCFVWIGGNSYYDNFLPYRFRIDPVPGIHCWHFRHFYKRPRSMNEKRAWYNSEGFGRARRSPRLLPDAWDDYPRGKQGKSWKNRKIKKQWE